MRDFLAERSWLYRLGVEPSPERRLLGMMFGWSPVGWVVDWREVRTNHQLIKAGLDPDTSTGFDWPLWLRFESWWFLWAFVVDDWFKTRRWTRLRKAKG